LDATVSIFQQATVLLARETNYGLGTISSTFFPQKSSKKLGAGFKGRRSTPEN
jgi:hypothetical protein